MIISWASVLESPRRGASNTLPYNFIIELLVIKEKPHYNDLVFCWIYICFKCCLCWLQGGCTGWILNLGFLIVHRAWVSDILFLMFHEKVMSDWQHAQIGICHSRQNFWCVQMQKVYLPHPPSHQKSCLYLVLFVHQCITVWKQKWSNLKNATWKVVIFDKVLNICVLLNFGTIR